MKSIATVVILCLFTTCVNKNKKLPNNNDNIGFENKDSYFYGQPLTNLPSYIFSNDTLNNYLKKIDLNDKKEIEEVLTSIYLRDQQFRDSLQNDKYVSDRKDKFYRKKIVQSDQVNRKIVKYILNEIGWPDTQKMNEMAHYAFWYTLFHNNDSKYLSTTIIHIENAFNDSIISPKYYSSLIDRILVKCGKKQFYGTYPSFDKNGKRIIRNSISISIDSINIKRESIGLGRILLD